jgi:hypothetical protein
MRNWNLGLKKGIAIMLDARKVCNVLHITDIWSPCYVCWVRIWIPWWDSPFKCWPQNMFVVKVYMIACGSWAPRNPFRILEPETGSASSHICTLYKCRLWPPPPHCLLPRHSIFYQFIFCSFVFSGNGYYVCELHGSILVIKNIIDYKSVDISS